MPSMQLPRKLLDSALHRGPFGRALRQRMVATLLSTPPLCAQAGDGELGYVLFFGLAPLMALAVAALIYLFVSRAPWHHRAWSVLALVAAVMTLFILLASRTIEPTLYAVPFLWLFPIAAWVAVGRFFATRRQQKSKRNGPNA